ncbi:MAG: hypothetical protein HUU37_00420 [Bdellovibrionales bacterium]|nr:hypothetical protein [Bdellovibrionales bacterium]
MPLLLLLLLLIPRLGLAAPAREFRFQNRQFLTFQMREEEWNRFSSKVYEFVTKRIGDPRADEAIEIVFDPAMECAGFVSREPGREREIRISTRIRSHVDFQVVLAHELTHVLRHAAQPDEAHWLDEGLAKWMEWGYVGDFPSHYAREIARKGEVNLTDGSFDCGTGDGYGGAYLLMLYLHNHLGGSRFISELARSPLKGWDAVEGAAQNLRVRRELGLPPALLTRKSLIWHFSLALLLNDPFAADFALLQIDSRFVPFRGVRVTAGEKCAHHEVTPQGVRPAIGGNLAICTP